MRFVQLYLGLPVAMVVISAVFVPAYHGLKVYTAYEYLEHRFDVRVRCLGAVLFLIGRGLAAGITLYAPAIILSSILGWPLERLIWAMGALVVLYTVTGGTRAVTITQKHQMVVMLAGMAVASTILLLRLPEGVSLPAAVKLAGALDRMNVVSFEVTPSNRYNLWSGLAGGFFLALSYFGTDQSQVQRYLAGRSVTDSRLGLLFNGIFKVPMQFVILFMGVLVFVSHLFVAPPIFFNTPTLARVAGTPQAVELDRLEGRFAEALAAQRAAARSFLAAADGPGAPAARERLRAAARSVKGLRDDAKALVARAAPDAETKDADYVFISFILTTIPRGLVGLLIAVIFCAAMSSTASELSALATTTTIDLHRRLRGTRPGADAAGDLRVSRAYTVMWGALAVAFATYASLLANLIQAVNILGSIFYGTILGLFVVAFFVKRVTATPVLVGALAGQATIIVLYFWTDVGFLWFNVIGCGIVIAVSLVGEVVRAAVRG